MNKITFFKIILLSLIATNAFGQNAAYYINQQTGDDSNDGLTPLTHLNK